MIAIVAVKAVVTVPGEQSRYYCDGLPQYPKRSVLLTMGAMMFQSAVDKTRIVSMIVVLIIVMASAAIIFLVALAKTQPITAVSKPSEYMLLRAVTKLG